MVNRDDKKASKPAAIDSISDLAEQSRRSSQGLKKGKSSGITSDFGSASDILLTSVTQENTTEPKYHWGEQICGEVDPELFQQAIQSLTAIFDRAPNAPDVMFADSPEPGKVVATYIEQGQKQSFHTSQQNMPGGFPHMPDNDPERITEQFTALIAEQRSKR